MSMRKTTLAEALSPYTDPFTAAQALRNIADDLDRVAGRIGSTELAAFQCVKPLGLGTPTELHSLTSLGLNVSKKGATWFIDTRDFRKWANRQIDVLNVKNKTYKAPEPVFGPQELF